MCISRGVMPQASIDTVLVPIYKNKLNIHDKNNYRPIVLATVVSKLFENFILQKISLFITTSSNQFGFERKHNVFLHFCICILLYNAFSMCVFIVLIQCVFLYKQAVSYYINQNSPVFSIFLDASKAFDRVNHKLLFKNYLIVMFLLALSDYLPIGTPHSVRKFGGEMYPPVHLLLVMVYDKGAY